jgi:hypothetical protein
VPENRANTEAATTSIITIKRQQPGLFGLLHSACYILEVILKILVACEYSGVVRRAFEAEGHDVISCDLLPAEDDSPYHYPGPVEDMLKEGGKWDLMIAHPPCTYLCSSGLHWNGRVPGRAEKTEEALKFVQMLMDADIPKIAIENPMGRIGTAIRKADQVLQPWHYGHCESKATCLWLKGLPLLKPSKIVPPAFYGCKCGHKFDIALGVYGCPNCEGDYGAAKPRYENQTASGQNKLAPSKDRWKDRSRTYEGIAAAMAQQWGRI